MRHKRRPRGTPARVEVDVAAETAAVAATLGVDLADVAREAIKSWGAHLGAIADEIRQQGGPVTRASLEAGLRRLDAASERHDVVGHAYAKAIGRSVAVDTYRRLKAKWARAEREAAERAAEEERAQERERLLTAAKERADRMRPELTARQREYLDAALRRLAAVHKGDGYDDDTPGSIDHLGPEERRAVMREWQARRRGMQLLAQGCTASGRRILPPAPEELRRWVEERPGSWSSGNPR